MAGPAAAGGGPGAPLSGAHRGALRAGPPGGHGPGPGKRRHLPVPHPRVHDHFHGTGDIFSAACAGAMVRGKGLPDALRLAADFTLACIQATQRDPNAPWYGVEFEKALHLLPGLLER